MRLTTIWTLPGLPFRERLSRTHEAALRAVAHRLPRRLAMWSFIDSGVRYMEPGQVVPEARYMDILKTFGEAVDA